MPLNCSVLIMTGTCGSGKSTVAELIARCPGWSRVSEDAIWPRYVGKNRGVFGTPEHKAKRAVVHGKVLARVQAALRMGDREVLDATVQEAPPEVTVDRVLRDFMGRDS
jgi:predicted kinase